MVPTAGFDPTPTVPQTVVLATNTTPALARDRGFEPRPTESESVILPIDESPIFLVGAVGIEPTTY